MKKIWIILWSVTLVAILIFLVRQSFVKRVDSPLKYSVHEGSDSTVFSKPTLDSLLGYHNYVILTIGSTECDMCKILKPRLIADSLHTSHYSIEVEKHKDNQLIAQALRVRGFPTSYVIDQNYNVLGVIRGLAHFEERLSDIINQHDAVYVDTIPNVDVQNTLPMLSHAFKSLLAYHNSDKQEMYAQAHSSLSRGSYFFNNYLLYSYHSNLNNQDSAGYYRNKALTYAQDVDVKIYESLIEEFDPRNPELQHMRLHDHEHNDRHDHDH